jgi:hypothetical protein
MITYEVKLTRRGRHYVIVWHGERRIYVTRGAYASAEPALIQARNYVKGTPETEAEPQLVTHFIYLHLRQVQVFFKKLLMNRR